MLTNIPDNVLNTHEGAEANRIIRSCVHCGFCTANCPTYRLLGDELDSPRGRIYLIKELLEGKQKSIKSLTHLDRCLTCRACETYCPSGVEYGHLLEIGRSKMEEKIQRTFFDRFFRYVLRKILPFPERFNLLLGLGRLVRPIMPDKLKKMIPVKERTFSYKPNLHSRQMIIFSGCVQPSISPGINESCKLVLDKLGITVKEIKDDGCCGAIDHHMAENKSAILYFKKNIDNWWPHISGKTEAIICTASGCGVMIKDYGYILRNDPVYAEKAEKVSNMVRDIAEIINDELSEEFIIKIKKTGQKYAFHSPCTLQHGQKLNGLTENLLTRMGFKLNPVKNSHICCGSAGVYSLLQKDISSQLREDKIRALEVTHPEEILTANIGCQLHLQQATDVKVRHWIELLADRISS